MRIRRGLAALGMAAIITAGTTLVAASPASAAVCGKTYDVYVSSLGKARGHSHYTTNCKTLAGNIIGWRVTGYVEQTSAGRGYLIMLEATIAGTRTVEYADNNLPHVDFDIAGAGPNATCTVFTSVI